MMRGLGEFAVIVVLAVVTAVTIWLATYHAWPLL